MSWSARAAAETPSSDLWSTLWKVMRVAHGSAELTRKAIVATTRRRSGEPTCECSIDGQGQEPASMPETQHANWHPSMGAGQLWSFSRVYEVFDWRAVCLDRLQTALWKRLKYTTAPRNYGRLNANAYNPHHGNNFIIADEAFIRRRPNKHPYAVVEPSDLELNV
jgi:hypothetical protein